LKKILYIVSTLKRSGPTNQLYSLIKYLDRAKYEPYLVTLSPEPVNSRWNDYQALGVHLYSLNLSRIKGFFCIKKNLLKLFIEIKPDIIHTQGIRADLLNAGNLYNKYLTLCTSHNYPFEDYPLKFSKLLGMFMAYNHIKTFRKLCVIACSKTVQSKLNTHGLNVSVVQNGIDLQKYKPVTAEEKKILRQQFNIPMDLKIFISVGALIPRKDMMTIIKAFKNLSGKNIKLIILGDGPQKVLLEKSGSSAVQFPGSVVNVIDYLQIADVFISASLSEGLPYSVLETMACGLPCILSDIPSHRELFEHNTDIFFPCGDDKKLTRILETLDSCRLDSLKLLSLDTVQNQFSAEKMSQGYQNHYHLLLNKNDEK
jgi:glycosyltransferase involved in cell wall biosynthesis